MFKRFTAGMAVGYVLGARAGDKRYKQLVALAEQAMDVPAVSRAMDAGRDFANDRGRDLVENLRGRASERLDSLLGNQPTEDDSDEDDSDEYDDVEDDRQLDDRRANDRHAEDRRANDRQAEDRRANDRRADDHEDDNQEVGDRQDDDWGDHDSDLEDSDSGSERGEPQPTKRRTRRPRRQEHPPSRRNGNRQNRKPRIGQLAAAAVERGRVD